MIRGEIVQATMYAAVVRAPDGVRFVAAGQWADELAPPLVEYVEQRCDDVLWPSEALQVRALIADSQPYAAITAYFEHVGSRWDEERLKIHLVSRDNPLAWRGRENYASA